LQTGVETQLTLTIDRHSTPPWKVQFWVDTWN